MISTRLSSHLSSPLSSPPVAPSARMTRSGGAEIFALTRRDRDDRTLLRESVDGALHFGRVALLTAGIMATGYVVFWKPVLERWVF